jgi:NADH pyrophosphatase NudC (nudix superfamily)
LNATKSDRSRAQAPAASGAAAKDAPSAPGKTNLFCPVCGHEFLPEEIGKKPHCRRCGYLESCCNPE